MLVRPRSALAPSLSRIRFEEMNEGGDVLSSVAIVEIAASCSICGE